MALDLKQFALPQKTGLNLDSFKTGQVSEQTPATEPGIVQSVVQGIAKPFLKIASSGRAIMDMIVANSNKEVDAANARKYDYGYFGKVGSLQSPIESIGTGLEIGATVAPAAGPLKALSVPAKVAFGSGIGGTMGLGSSLSEGLSTKDTLINTLVGGVTGGATVGATEAVSKVVQKLPNWLAKSALPKLKSTNINYAIENTPIGSTAKMLEHSNNSVANYSEQIRTILAHPEYSNQSFLVRQAQKGEHMNFFQQLANSFQNSEYTPQSVLKVIKDYVPGQAKLVEKIANETATLAEQNEVRSAIDVANKSIYNMLSRPPETKSIAQGFADILRQNIQSSAPETRPIFQNFTRELDLNKVLTTLDKKNQMKPTLYDIIAGIEGFRQGGIQGGLGAIAAERLVRSKASQLVGAKVANVVSKTAPAISKTGQLLNVPITQSATLVKTKK